MKLNILKDKYGYKAGTQIELDDTEANELIEKGLAEAVKVDEVEEAVKAIELRLSTVADELVEQISEKAAAKTLDKVGKGLSKRRATIVVGPDNIEADPKRGFKSMGEFARSVAKAANDAGTDERLRYVNKSGMTEGVSADGGYAVPTDYANQVFTLILGEDQLIANTTQFRTNTAHVKLPIDNLSTIGTYAVNGSMVAADGTQMTASGSGAFNQLSFDLKAYYSLISITNELLEDNNVMLGDWIIQMAGRDLDYKINHGLVQGIANGATGIVGNAATVNVTADSADEYVSGVGISYKDITNMHSHWYRTRFATYDSCVWLVNYSVLPQIEQLKDAANRLIYFPPGGLANQPYPTLMGIRVVPTWHCSRLGYAGDIVLADLKGYISVLKADGVQAAQSMHLYFDKNSMAFRFVFRLDGKPGLAAPYTLPDGSGWQISPFVTLANRT